jgi:hypothetical protein
MSPMLQIRVPGMGGASIQPWGAATCRPSLSSWASRVEQVWAMQRDTGQHARIIARQLGAEVQPFLQVRLPGGELAAHREETPPGPAAAFHGDLQLVRRGQREDRQPRDVS